MKRRQILTGLGVTLGGLIGHSLSVERAIAGTSSNVQKSQKLQWGYIGENDPNHWNEVSERYQVCQFGQRQSPINVELLENETLKVSDKRKIGLFEGFPEQIYFRYGPVNLEAFDAGYTLQANVGAGLFLELGSDRYELKQFHFHTPSEHQINGNTSAMEMHLVHQNQGGDFAVVALMIEENKNRQGQGMSDFEKDLEPLWNFLDGDFDDDVNIKLIPSVHLAKILPRDRHFFRYSGSLTTPPCSETVEWIIFRKPLTLSTENLGRYKAHFPRNARPIQRL
ncbi:MAG: carbonic anhydrase [Cyanophyceae cyanobacterium]